MCVELPLFDLRKKNSACWMVNGLNSLINNNITVAHVRKHYEAYELLYSTSR